MSHLELGDVGFESEAWLRVAWRSWSLVSFQVLVRSIFGLRPRTRARCGQQKSIKMLTHDSSPASLIISSSSSLQAGSEQQEAFFNFRDENKNFFFSLQKWGWFSQELSRLRIHVGLYTTMQQGGSVIELTLPVLRLLGFEQILPRKHFSSLESEGEPPKYSWLKFDGMTRSRRMLYYKWTGWIEWISGWVS